MPRVRAAIATLLAAALASLGAGCARAERSFPVPAAAGESALHRFVGTAMGCPVEITIDSDDADGARSAARLAQLELDRIDSLLSDWKRGSDLSRLNDARGPRVEVAPELREVLAESLRIAAATDGRFDPTVGAAVALWRASRQSGALPAAAALAEALARTGAGKVVIDGDAVIRPEGLRIDFGGIGKGYGTIRALAILRESGFPRALVAVAGDIAAGEPPRGRAGWRIEIAPEREGAPAESLEVSRAAVSTSGGSAQWVEIAGARYAHIVDPRTALGATTLAQATVIGPLAPSVDALGTALALTKDDGEAASILARFPGHRARIERAGKTAWLGDAHPARAAVRP